MEVEYFCPLTVYECDHQYFVDSRTIVCLYLIKREESSMQGKLVISQAIDDIFFCCIDFRFSILN